MPKDLTAPHFRRATEADAPALARLHVEVWHETYADLAPAEAIAALDYAHRLNSWRETLADPARETLLAEDDGMIGGLIALGPGKGEAFGRLPGPVGEIKHLYVAASARRQGLGARLMMQGFSRLQAQGYRSAALGVVRQNYAARLFYADIGGREVADYTDPGPLWRSLMVLVSWDLPEAG